MHSTRRSERISNQQRLDALRRRASAAMPDWRIEPQGGRIVMTASDGPNVDSVATLCDEANLDNRDFLVCLPEEHFFLIDQYNKLSELYRRLVGASSEAVTAGNAKADKQARNNARECAMLCGDNAFRKFLSIVHDIDTSDDERIKVGVRKLLDVQSRAELNSNPEAAARWRDLVGKFKLWMRGL